MAINPFVADLDDLSFVRVKQICPLALPGKKIPRGAPLALKYSLF